jgi:hypothetical protein
MNITLKNAWLLRDEVIKRCKKQKACKPEFEKLLQAETEESFLEVLRDNFFWVDLERIFDYNYGWASDFKDGFAVVELNKKYGYLKPDGTYLIEPKFDETWGFENGFARVKLNGKWGFIKPDGTYFIEPKFDMAMVFKNGFAVVKLKDKWGRLSTTGEYEEIEVR